MFETGRITRTALSQEEQHKQLGELTKENAARIERMAGELKAAKARVEEAKYSGPGGRGGARKSVDVYEERLAAAATRLERSKDKVRARPPPLHCARTHTRSAGPRARPRTHARTHARARRHSTSASRACSSPSSPASTT